MLSEKANKVIHIVKSAFHGDLGNRIISALYIVLSIRQAYSVAIFKRRFSVQAQPLSSEISHTHIDVLCKKIKCNIRLEVLVNILLGGL